MRQPSKFTIQGGAVKGREQVDASRGTMAVLFPMKVTINGETQDIEPCTLAALLERLKLHEARCATMINGRIVRRAERETTELQAGDSVDIISMVGGG